MCGAAVLCVSVRAAGMGKGGGKGGDGTSLRQRSVVNTVELQPSGAADGGLAAPLEHANMLPEQKWASYSSTPPCNLTIDGELYDCAGYDHPGGDIIWDAADQDATSLFYSTHPMYVWKLLKSKAFEDKYKIKRDDATVVKAQEDSGSYTFTDEFYVDCKKVVEQHLKERNEKYGKYMDSAIVALWSLSWYVIAVASYWYCMASGGSTFSSIQLGMLWAMAIFNL